MYEEERIACMLATTAKKGSSTLSSAASMEEESSTPPTANVNQQQQPQYANMVVATKPILRDPREVQTIITTSLRNLWGNLERYSATLQVTNFYAAAFRHDDDDDPTSNHEDDNSSNSENDDNDSKVDKEDEESSSGLFLVKCPAAHAARVQSALTLVTPPHYLQDTLYRFDVIKIEYG